MNLPAPRAATAAPADDALRARLPLLVEGVEQRLADLQSSLATRDMPCVELHAAELQRALAAAVEGLVQAARQGGPPVPLELRRRLGLAGARIAALRDALARASAALDRAIDVLMPDVGAPLVVYSAGGSATQRASSTGSVQA